MKAYKNVCYVATLYTLLLFLLKCEDDEIDSTFYVLDESFPKGFENRLRNSYKIKKPKLRGIVSLFTDWIYYRIICWFRLPRLDRNTNLYIQDHKTAAKIYSRHHDYTLLEDSPGVCSRVFSNFYGLQMKKQRSRWDFIFFQLLYGKLWGYSFGSSNQCVRLLLTKDDYHEILKGKEKIILPKIDNNLWENLSSQKQKRILEIFDLKSEDVKLITSKEYLLLTDPIWPDDAPRAEHERIFKELIARYPKDDLMIKTHPRDVNFPYEKKFQNIFVFRKAIPIEIFSLLDVKFKTIITLFSTAAFQFGKEVDVHWYGTEVSKYCYNHYGHIVPPINANIKKL